MPMVTTPIEIDDEALRAAADQGDFDEFLGTKRPWPPRKADDEDDEDD